MSKTGTLHLDSFVKRVRETCRMAGEAPLPSRGRTIISPQAIGRTSPAAFAASHLSIASHQIAPGAPGGPSRWTRSTKEGLGTAYHTSRTLWFTLSHGIVDEIYHPTIDQMRVASSVPQVTTPS
jgi:hypothetical protein